MPRRTTPRPEEPLWYLRVIPYNEYRQSAWWTSRRRAFREKRIEEGKYWTCDMCGAFWALAQLDEEFPKWHVHHLTYARLGAEHDEDLAWLCSPCHHLVHFPDAQQSRAWLAASPYLPDDLEQRAAKFRTEWDRQSVTTLDEDPGF